MLHPPPSSVRFFRPFSSNFTSIVTDHPSSPLNSPFQIIKARIFPRTSSQYSVFVFRFPIDRRHSPPIALFVLADILVSMKPLSATRGQAFSPLFLAVREHLFPAISQARPSPRLSNTFYIYTVNNCSYLPSALIQRQESAVAAESSLKSFDKLSPALIRFHADELCVACDQSI